MLRHTIFAALLLAAASAALADPGKGNGKGGGWKGGNWKGWNGGWSDGDWDDGDWDDDWGESYGWGRGPVYGNGYYSPGYGLLQGYGPRIYVQPGYYSGGAYGYGGYRTYDGYVDGGDLLPGASFSYSVDVPYDGPGVAIFNRTDVELNFTIDDRRPVRIAPGETMRLTEKGQFVVRFDRGSDFGSARYTVHEGHYDFTPTDGGWELFRQKADHAIAVQPNPAVVPRTAERPRSDSGGGLRTAERPRIEELPPPSPKPY